MKRRQTHFVLTAKSRLSLGPINTIAGSLVVAISPSDFHSIERVTMIERDVGITPWTVGMMLTLFMGISAIMTIKNGNTTATSVFLVGGALVWMQAAIYRRG
ncbi:MAG: hypothetical protein ABEI86_01305 [Halobacteriaceae archaeon]